MRTGQSQPRPAELALQRVLATYLERHAGPSVTWRTNVAGGLVIDIAGREQELACGTGLDEALRQLRDWGAIRTPVRLPSNGGSFDAAGIA